METERRGRKMDRRLYEAAITGDLSLLDEPLRERIASLSKAEENPLHIASWFGRAHFVREVLRLNQSLTGGLNSQGLSPLHLASLKGHLEVAKVLLVSDPDVCFIRDKKGRTPLHIAAEKGQFLVLRALVKAEPRAAWMMTDGGDPILHVCIRHNQLEAVFDLLEELRSTVHQEELMDEFINLKDDDGNTILHLLAGKGQHQAIASLVRLYKALLDVNAMNIHHVTALDISMQHSIDDWLKVKRILLNARARTAKEVLKYRPNEVYQHEPLVYQKRIKNLQLEKYLEWVSKTRETLMVVAILMATVTFQAGMNPPGGVWQSDDPNNKDIRAGESIMSYIDPRRYISFMIFNSLGFAASLSLIVVLVGRFSVDDKVALWTAMVWITVISILLIYTCSLSFLSSRNVSAKFRRSGSQLKLILIEILNTPISFSNDWGLIFTGILLLMRLPRPVTWLLYILGLTWLYKKINRISRLIQALIKDWSEEAWTAIQDWYEKAWTAIKHLFGHGDKNVEARGNP